jgi:hypothetical protein
MAILVSIVCSLAMITARGCLAWLVYRYVGLRFVSRSWFNLDAAWAFSLVLVGALSLAFSLVPVVNQIRTYWWCSPPRTGRQSMRPARSTARETGASFSKDRCVRTSL